MKRDIAAEIAQRGVANLTNSLTIGKVHALL